MSRNIHSEADRAVWIMYVVQSTAEDLSKTFIDTLELLDRYGLIKWVLDGYRSLHTQGFEYMAELLSDKLKEAQAQ